MKNLKPQGKRGDLSTPRGRIKPKAPENAIHESEANYRLLSETALHGVIHQDVSGRIIDINPAAELILGKTRQELLGGSSMGEEYPTISEDGSPFPGLEHPAMLALKSGQSISGVIMGILNPVLGAYQWIKIDAIPMFHSGEKKPYQVRTVFEDITDRKHAEVETARLSSFPMLNPNPVLEADANGKVLFCNPAARKLFPDIYQHGVQHPFMAGLDDIRGELEQSIEAVPREIRVDDRWYHQTIHYLRKAQRIRIYGFDITNRKLAEDAIQRHSAVLEGINTILALGLGPQTEGELCEAVLNIIENLTGSAISFIGEIGADGFLHDLAISDTGWDACRMVDQAGHRKAPGNFKVHGIYGRVLSDGHGLIANDPRSHPDSIGLPKGHIPLSSFLGVPLVREEKTAGIIAVGNRAGGYRSEELQILESIAPAVMEAVDRKRVEKKLLCSEETFSDLIERAPFGIYAVNAQFRISQMNIGSQKGLFQNVRPIIGRDLGEAMHILWPDPVADEIIASFRRTLETGEPYFSPRFVKLRRDIELIEAYEWELHRMALPDGQYGVVCYYFDSTRLRQAEAALQEANASLETKVEERTRELALRAAQLRALAGELTLSEQRERSRLAKILHDHLQQLLVAAKFRSAILGRSGDEIIRQGSKEVEELIDESITASRSLTAELSPPILHDAGLNAGLQWLARRMTDKQGLFVELEIQGNEDLPQDIKVLLFESVRELLFNVVKHAHTHSATVNVRRIHQLLQVIVSDQGVGFDPAAMPAVGEGGKGFGLFSIRERVELMGGTLDIASNPGQGSRFVLSLPVTREAKKATSQAQESAAHPEAQTTRPSQHDTGRRIRVLLADDHAVVRQGIANLLGEQKDMEVVGEAADGQEAIVQASKLLPDVILMDMSMPKLNGVEATRIIHNDRPDIRIIGLSMFEEAQGAKAMRDAGAIHFVSKSSPAEKLVEIIRASIRKEPEPGGCTVPLV